MCVGRYRGPTWCHPSRWSTAVCPLKIGHSERFHEFLSSNHPIFLGPMLALGRVKSEESAWEVTEKIPYLHGSEYFT